MPAASPVNYKKDPRLEILRIHDVFDAIRTTPALRCGDPKFTRHPARSLCERRKTRHQCVQSVHDITDRAVLPEFLKLPVTAPTMLTNTRPASAFICRSCLRSTPVRGPSQKRWVGQKYVQKLLKAEEDWAAIAAEIGAGRRKNPFDELDERGFIKDIVG